MKSRLPRAGLIAVEVFGVSVAALVALVAFVLWRAQSGPVSLRPLAPVVSAFANSSLGGRISVTQIGAITLTRAEAGAYRVTMNNVELGERGADAAGVLPLVDLAFMPADLLSGKPGPRRVLIDGAELRVTRRVDDKLDVDLGDAGGDRVRALQFLTGGKYFREAFETAELRNAKITFRDAASGRSWSGRNGNGVFRRTAYGYDAKVTSAFENGTQISDLALSADYRLETEILSADMTLDRAPVGDLITMLFNRRTNFLTSPISGRAEIKINKNGEVISSHLAGRAGGGALTVGSFTTKVASIETDAAFDPASKTFDVQKLAWATDAGQGELSGLVELSLADETNAVDGVSFAFTGNALTLSPPDFFESGLVIDRLVLDGAYEIATRRLVLGSIDAATSGLDISGALNLTGPARGEQASPGVEAKLKASGAVDVPTLLRIWPTKVADSAREFVETRIPKGTFSTVDFTMALPVGGVVDGRMADEAMRLTFYAADATVLYALGRTSGGLTYNDLQIDSPYNTR
ncbi:MAG: hypothetical protein KDA46_01090, partial [Parvularculaceae bacterium]|nr:hypothetical protein [Parvularculaceae bacterium]